DWLVGLSPQKRPRLRELFVPGGSEGEESLATRAVRKLLERAEWRAEPLPAALAKVASLAEACVQTGRLLMEVALGTLTPLDREQVSPTLMNDPDFKALLDAGRYRLFGSPREIHLRWRFEDEIVATLN